MRACRQPAHQGMCQPVGSCSRGQQTWKDSVAMNQASTSQRQDRLVWPSRVQLSGSASTISWGQPSSSARSALLMMGVQLAAPPGKCCSWGQQGAGGQAGRQVGSSSGIGAATCGCSPKVECSRGCDCAGGCHFVRLPCTYMQCPAPPRFRAQDPRLGRWSGGLAGRRCPRPHHKALPVVGRLDCAHDGR